MKTHTARKPRGIKIKYFLKTKKHIHTQTHKPRKHMETNKQTKHFFKKNKIPDK
jgi:hypothetical protein